MPKIIFCQKLKKELEGFDFSPYPGPLAEKIVASISRAAWAEWLKRQTMFINEYRLNLLDPKSRAFLEREMQSFLFEESEKAPPGYVPQDKK